MNNRNISIGLGPMSKEIINSINLFSKKFNKKIMLISSRNQIECSKLGNGYVNNFSTKEFSKFILSKKNKNLIMCRDHSGPFKGSLKNKNLYKEIENCKESLYNDIHNDFQIIHIDTSECGSEKYSIAKELIEYCEKISIKLNKKIKFEFGCEDHGVSRNLKQFNSDVIFFSQFKNSKYIVCQTGSLVKSIFQVGHFDINKVKLMKKIAKKHNLLLKEHNCDYLNEDQLLLRKISGIDAINVAPELAFIQSNLIYTLCEKYNLNKELKDFINIVIKSKKWLKWKYYKENNYIKFLTSAHYLYTSSEYIKIINKINKRINFQKLLNKKIEKNLYKYFF